MDLSFSLLDCDRLQARLIISLNKYSRGSTGTSRLPSPAPGTQGGLINVWGTVKKQKGTLPLQGFGLTVDVANERMQETGKFNVEKAKVCVHSLKKSIGQDTQMRHGCWRGAVYLSIDIGSTPYQLCDLGLLSYISGPQCPHL